MTDKEQYDEEYDDDDDEYDVVFSPDEDMLLYINEVTDLKDLVESQSEQISELEKQIKSLKKRLK
tara:strand:- start:99 stop:293 length:195 start_codon:yes stop_codon:yes gene_type:complete